MAIIRDIMPAFELFQPANTDDAVALLSKYGNEAWPMAGGLDTFDWLKVCLVTSPLGTSSPNASTILSAPYSRKYLALRPASSR